MQYPCTVSDVDTQYYVFPDGSTDMTLPSGHGVVRLVDVVLSAAGTDTTRGNIYVNQKFTGEQILNAANLGTNFSRQFMGAPIAFAPAARIKIQQIA